VSAWWFVWFDGWLIRSVPVVGFQKHACYAGKDSNDHDTLGYDRLVYQFVTHIPYVCSGDRLCHISMVE
jgi:hypothetical protein